MRVLCRHGHFAFFPAHAEDIAKFSDYYDTELVRDRDFYTFPALQDAPRYSILGKPFINLPAIATYEGREPWDVMRENDFVYNLATGLILPKLSILFFDELPQVGLYFLPSTPLLQPGTRNALGRQVLSYDGEYIDNPYQLRITEYAYE